MHGWNGILLEDRNVRVNVLSMVSTCLGISARRKCRLPGLVKHPRYVRSESSARTVDSDLETDFVARPSRSRDGYPVCGPVSDRLIPIRAYRAACTTSFRGFVVEASRLEANHGLLERSLWEGKLTCVSQGVLRGGQNSMVSCQF